MEYKILIIKNRYKKKLNFKTGLDWFEKNTPLKIVVGEITTDYDFTFKEVGNGTFKGTVPKDYAKLTEVVPRGKYHAVVLVLGNDVPWVRVSITEDVPLYPDTEFIYLAKDTDKGKTLNHELFHCFFKVLSRKGIHLNDPMDSYLNDSNLNAKVSNRTMALELLKPYWERIVKPNSIIQNIVATVTPKKKYKYFSDSEIVGLDSKLVEMLDKARDIAGVPFKINSGFRTPEQNKKAGGVKDSSHMSGKAVDIACTSDSNRHKIVTALLTVGFNRIGVAKTFIHADIDSTKSSNVIWLYD
jgi:hypothetical protein